MTITGQPRFRRTGADSPSTATSAIRVARGRSGVVRRDRLRTGSGKGSRRDRRWNGAARARPQRRAGTPSQVVMWTWHPALTRRRAPHQRGHPDWPPTTSTRTDRTEGPLGVVPDGTAAPVAMVAMSSIGRSPPRDRRQADRLVRRRGSLLGIDPVLVRVGAVLLGLSGGIGIVLYLAGCCGPRGGRPPSTCTTSPPLGAQVAEGAWVFIVAVTCFLAFAASGFTTPFGFGPSIVLA